MTLKLIAVSLLALSMLAMTTTAAGTARLANPMVVMETSMGTIKIELFEDKAPITVKNFLAYVDDKHYDGTVFHRIIDGFMIQGGGFEPGMKQKPTKEPIKNEANNGVANTKYTLAMARTTQVDSATSQFFINVKDNDFLDHKGPASFGYCVFGRVVAGMEVVDKIKGVKTANKGGTPDVPVEDVVIKSVKRATK